MQYGLGSFDGDCWGYEEFCALIGRDPSRYCALICWDYDVAVPALIRNNDTTLPLGQNARGITVSFQHKA